MERFVLTDAQWAKIEPHCLGKPTDSGRSGRNNRLFLDAVLWIARTGTLGFQAHVGLCRELTVAIAQRDAEILAMRERLGLRAAEETRKKLAGTMIDAEQALLSAEAPDVPALRWKVDYLLTRQVEGETSKLPRGIIEQARTEVAKLLEGEEAAGFFDRFRRWFGD